MILPWREDQTWPRILEGPVLSYQKKFGVFHLTWRLEVPICTLKVTTCWTNLLFLPASARSQSSKQRSQNMFMSQHFRRRSLSRAKLKSWGRRVWIVELNFHLSGVLCFGKVLLVCHSGLSPVTPPGSERLQENNRPSGSFQPGYISHLGQYCVCAFYSWQDEKSWLNKNQLLFIHLLFWLMASESHSSGLKIDRWLPSLHCGLLKISLWCDYSKYLACAPGDKVDLWSYSSFKKHSSCLAQCDSVVEHWTVNPGGHSSIPSGGICPGYRFDPQ